MDIGVKMEIITVDSLKLAHLDLDSPVQVAQPRPLWRPPGKGSHIPTYPFQVPQPLGTPLPTTPSRPSNTSAMSLPVKHIPVRGDKFCRGQFLNISVFSFM